MFKNRTPEVRKRLDTLHDKFKKGQLLDILDFEAVGFNKISMSHALMSLRDEYGLDILNVCRGKKSVGWILADEIL